MWVLFYFEITLQKNSPSVCPLTSVLRFFIRKKVRVTSWWLDSEGKNLRPCQPLSTSGMCPFCSRMGGQGRRCCDLTHTTGIMVCSPGKVTSPASVAKTGVQMTSARGPDLKAQSRELDSLVLSFIYSVVTQAWQRSCDYFTQCLSSAGIITLIFEMQ